MPGRAWLSQAAPGCAQMGIGVVPELDDQRVTFEHGLHDSALDPLAAAVNEPKFAEAGVVCGLKVFFDH